MDIEKENIEDNIHQIHKDMFYNCLHELDVGFFHFKVNRKPSKIWKCEDCGNKTFLIRVNACFSSITHGNCCEKDTCLNGCLVKFPCGCFHEVDDFDGYKFDAKCKEHDSLLELSQTQYWSGKKFSEPSVTKKYIEMKFEDMCVYVPEKINDVIEY